MCSYTIGGFGDFRDALREREDSIVGCVGNIAKLIREQFKWLREEATQLERAVAAVQRRIDYAMVAELLKREKFTFGEWVEAHGGDQSRAIAALQSQDILFYLDMAETCEIWDGSFCVHNGIPYYEGSDGSSGGSGVIHRISLATSDVITILNRTRAVEVVKCKDTV